MDADKSINEAAALWAARTSDPDFEDWSGFTAWLEQDPAHNHAYDSAIAAAAEYDELVRVAEVEPVHQQMAANDQTIAANDEPSSPLWAIDRRWFGGAIAASLAAMFAFSLAPTGTAIAQYETQPGERLAIELDNGARIDMGGGSRIELSGEGQRLANLIEGQAVFSVNGDGTQGFEVKARGDTIIDVGTVFDVRLSADHLHVEVAEGAVIVNPESRNLRLEPGQSVIKRGDEYDVSTVAIDQIGEWREGRVSFSAASLEEIAERLTRASGVSFSAGGSGEASYSGSVLVDPIKNDPGIVGQLLDIEVTQSETGWVLSPK